MTRKGKTTKIVLAFSFPNCPEDSVVARCVCRTGPSEPIAGLIRQLPTSKEDLRQLLVAEDVSTIARECLQRHRLTEDAVLDLRAEWDLAELKDYKCTFSDCIEIQFSE